MAVNPPWPDRNTPQQGFTLPVPIPIGPMALPGPKPKRRGPFLVAGALAMFAGGVAAGPTLQDYAYQGIEAGAIFLRTNLPPSWARYLPFLSEHAVAPPSAVVSFRPNAGLKFDYRIDVH